MTTTEQRFGFGKNWQGFIADWEWDQLEASREGIQAMLGPLEGASFLDAGSGSGLSSLAAFHLGAERVHSLDFDPDSVEATLGLREHEASKPYADRWKVERGDVTDAEYCSGLGTFDVVYSWGVIHHTGQMWAALENLCQLVAPGGRLFISVYNDQGRASRVWRKIKQTYNRLPPPLRLPYVLAIGALMEIRYMWGSLPRPKNYFLTFQEGAPGRGMDRWHDLIDWVGGYPFEVARPDEVFDFCHPRGFELVKLHTPGGLACNEFVFCKPA